ncbi:50S ribosomal protein L22 [Candidatus Gracilibacteria bacterium]|nr:MAG: 50S ribosomal protein L22 [Candidatus Gracilibacteria bacterium]
MKSMTRNVRISPKKLNVIAYIIRDKAAKEALDLLRFMPKKGAQIMHKALKSAVYNATHNDSQKLEDLKIARIVVTQGIMHKRINPVSKGRAHRILKRTSNISIDLSL